MTGTDLEKSVKESLRAADLLQYVDEGESQFLEFPDGLFAELVVKDGSKLPAVENIVQRFKADLHRSQEVELDEIVRPVWSVAKIERMGPSVSFPGLEPAVRFTVVLQSGSLSCTVEVDVTEAALGMIRERLNETKAPEDAALQEIVSEFMKMQLSHGGRSYWDPRRDSRLELNAAAMMYLFGRRDAYERLKQSIDEIFSPTVGSRKETVESFIRSMSYAQGGRKIRRFQDALTDLPGPGGAYKPGERLPRGNYELYELLFDDEKRDLESYYLDQVAKAEKDFPNLRDVFRAVFE
jgi:hypothetical protein